MLRALASGVVASALAMSASAAPAVSTPEAPAPDAYLAPGDYAGVTLVGYTARDPQPLYTEQLAPSCTRAAAVDGALGAAPAAGNGVLLGTVDGRIVVSESIRTFPSAKAARRFVAASQTTPACLVYAGRDSFHRVFAQYPQLPPIPELAPGVTGSGPAVSATFQGTTDAAPLAGTTALVTWGRYVAETSIRIAVPRPGELESLAHAVLSQVDYSARASTGPGTRAELAREADEVAGRFFAAGATAPYGLAPAARARIPSVPARCTVLVDAFVYSGIRAAVRGATGVDAGGVTVAAEILVFADEEAARRYFDHSRDLAGCLTDLHAGGLPPGSSAHVRRSPRRGVTASDGTERVAYRVTRDGPDGARVGVADVEVILAGRRAAAFRAEATTADATFDLRAHVAPVTQLLREALARH